MLSSSKIHIPWWLWIIIVLETLPMFLGPVAAITNPQIMGGPAAEAINQATYFYAIRNLAVGIAFLIAVLLRNAAMLFVLILIRLITDLGDLPIFLVFDLAQSPERAIGIFVVLYYIPAFIALRYLWKQMTDGA